MIRTYKAYDKKTGKIRDVVNIDYITKKVSLALPELLDDDLVLIREFDDVEVLEDTLIDDVEGKRIYTGYLLKYKGGMGEVVYKDSGYFVKNLETQNAVLALKQCIEVNWGKIIGTIYDT
jgi:hypothetical protein